MRRLIAGVILEDEFGRFLLQLRDNKPTIGSPNMWGLFGGSVEQGENPFDGALREIKEELCIELSPDRLQPFTIYKELPEKWLHIFHYPISRTELTGVVLMEGQRFGLWSQPEIVKDVLDGHIISPHTIMIMAEYFSRIDRTRK